MSAGIPGFAAPSSALHVGPFGRWEFLEVLHAHWGRGEMITASSDTGVAVAEVVDGTVTGVGPRNLVDYRSPRGPDGPALLAGLVEGRPFLFDSLPGEAAEALVEELNALGMAAEWRLHDCAAVLELPATFDEWLASIGKKERHETRRKRRRYEAMVGSPRVERFEEERDRFDEFVVLHRASAGAKGSFMTDAMEAYFYDLLRIPGWGIDALVSPSGSITAAGFGYHGDDGYYLYNSAYDAAYREASPGVVFIASLIEFAIEEGQQIFDFLKGDETYKFRLGASERPLYEVVAAP